jgi:hypothetical protein
LRLKSHNLDSILFSQYHHLKIQVEIVQRTRPIGLVSQVFYQTFQFFYQTLAGSLVDFSSLGLRLMKGFNYLGLRHITLPFADDFNLLTGHKVTQQNIIKEIVGWVTSMGLVLKPRKCKSLSIKAGCSAVVEFSLGDYAMVSIKQDPYMKFLGGFITYD